ncbi:MAG: signal peptidase I, partial [Eggerthella lenta]|nr:signal peptidase I [Eggerthella lenta]
IAVGGQTVDINDEDGLVYVDGVALSEPYTRGLPSYTLASDVSYPYTVPEGYLWMMGDNRTNSQDSRFFGAIPVSSVTGRGALVYWPLNDFSLLD